MKKTLILIAALAMVGCEKNDCATCSETYETRLTDVVAGTTRYETYVRKYSLCEQSDIDEVNGTVIVGDRIETGHLQYQRTNVTTTCD
jgi:hypothetical protein